MMRYKKNSKTGMGASYTVSDRVLYCNWVEFVESSNEIPSSLFEK